MNDHSEVPYHLRTLGRLTLHADDPGSEPVLRNAKALGVLAYLATIPGHAARRRHIADLFWPGAESRRGRRSLRQALYYLSQRTDTDLVRSDDGELALASDRLDVDLWRLDAALDEGRYEDAVALYGGPFLEGFEGKAGRELEGWIEAENERVWSGLKAAYHALIAEAREEGLPERAARHARAYAELNPLDENAQLALIRSLQEAGDEVAAFRAYERYRTLLREELGVEPGEEIEARVGDLRRELLAGGVQPAGGPTSAPGPPDAEPDARSAAGSGDHAGPRPGGERSREAPPAALDRRLWIAAAALAVAAVALAGRWIAPSGDGARTAWEAVEADLLADRREEAESLWHVRIAGGRVVVDPTDLGRSVLPDPTGRRIATVHRSVRGPDVELRSDGERTSVAATRWDEVPVAWAPDGRRLVFRRGRPRASRADLRWTAHTFDLETGEIRRLSELPLSEEAGAVAWSPTGTHLALTSARGGHAADIYRLDADGENVHRLTRHPSRDGEPAWSPGGERLAFVSWRTGGPHLWVMGADGSGLEQVTFGSTRARSPVWVSDQHLAFLSDREGGWDLWSLDLVTRRTRRLTRLGDFEPGRTRRWHRGPPERLVRRVRISPRHPRVSPGQHLSLDAVPLAGDGTAVPSARPFVRWTVRDTAVLARDSAWLRVRTTGEAEVVASAAGWRSDTLGLVSVPLERRRGLRALLEESWSDGIVGERWMTAGEPEPYVVRTDGATEGAPPRSFVSNGDENYDSGVVSRSPLPLERGVTLAFSASLPFDPGAPYQGLNVGLRSDLPDPDERSTRLGLADVVELLVAGEKNRLSVTAAGHVRELPWLDDPGGWHAYALQVAPDGSVSLVRDGRLHWRSEPGFVETARDAHLVLGGRSLGVELLVGPVTVQEGERYGFAGGDRR